MPESFDNSLFAVSKDDLRGSLRRCPVKKAVFLKSSLLRFTLNEDNSISWDKTGKMSGRGLWLSADFGQFSIKELTRGLSHSARARVVVSSELYNLVEIGLSEVIENAVKQVQEGKLAAFWSRSGGEIDATFKNALENSEIGTLIYAKDKLKSKDKEFILSKDESIRVAECDNVLFSNELDEWAWVALRKGSYAKQVWEDCRRLQALRTSLLKRNANSSSVKSMN